MKLLIMQFSPSSVSENKPSLLFNTEDEGGMVSEALGFL
jgi:hypothetical protein